MVTKRKGKISRNVGMNLRGINEVNLGDKPRFYCYTTIDCEEPSEPEVSRAITKLRNGKAP